MNENFTTVRHISNKEVNNSNISIYWTRYCKKQFTVIIIVIQLAMFYVKCFEHNLAEMKCIHTIVKLYNFTNIVCIALKITALTLYVVYSHSIIYHITK